MNNKKLLIISASAGKGHVRAAEALQKCALTHFPEVNVLHKDILEFAPAYFKKIYADGYTRIISRHQTLWHYLYHSMDKEPYNSVTNRLRRWIERIHTIKLDAYIDAVKPDYIICTHFMAPEILSNRIGKGAFHIPVWVQITDYDVHSLWVHPHVTGYLATNEEVAWRLESRGVQKEKIHITGIPIMPVFSQKLPRGICAKDLALDPKKITLLLMAGGEGVMPLDALAERILLLDPYVQLIIVAGKNENLHKKVQSLALKNPGRVAPIGFTTTIECLMSASDFALTKAGGLSTSECLAMGLPMILISLVAGQEERNANYVVERGAGFIAYDTGSIEYRVKKLLNNLQMLQTMQQNALIAGKPHAALETLKVVLGITS